MIDQAPPNQHQISTALVVVIARGGHATKPRQPKALVTAGYEVTPRVIKYAWFTSFTPIPKAPKGCIVRYGQNNAAAKRMGLVSVTWDCP